MSMTRLTLKGKCAIVTGGSRGIGRAVSLLLAKEGADVAIDYLRDDKAATTLYRTIRNLGRRSLLLKANVGNPTELREMFNIYKKTFGKLDILVHCASLGTFKPLLKTGIAQLSRVIGIHTSSLVSCIQVAENIMHRGSRVIAVSSLGSHRVVTNYGAIGVAKAALEAAVRYLAVELSERGIHVNAVSAGPIETLGLRSYPGYNFYRRESIQRTPFGRMGAPKDVARVVLFLCKPDSNWLCGETIIADGGLSLRLFSR